MSKGLKALLWVCVVMTVFAWGRLIWRTITTASPAHQINYVDATGAPVDRWSIHCHGPMYAWGEDAWQLCEQRRGEQITEFVTHFDLPNHTATLLKSPEGKGNFRSLTGVIPHPDGGLLVVAEQQVLHLTSSSVKRLAEGPALFTQCLRLDGRTLEMAGTRGLHQPQVSRLSLDELSWTHEKGVEIPVPKGYTSKGEGCRWTDEGWRFVWSQRSNTYDGGKTLDVQLMESTLQTMPAPTQLLRLPIAPKTDALGRNHARARALSASFVHLEDPLLDMTDVYAPPRSWGARPALVLRDGEWQEPPLPPEVSLLLTNSDYVVTDTGLEQLFVFEMPFMVRVKGQWVALSRNAHRDLYAQLLNARFEQGEAGPPIANSFWLHTGFKAMPSPQGGYWLMGGLGNAVVHVNDDFERTDELGFFGRMGRTMVEDRAKRNSDFYYGMGWLHRIGFWWVLLGGFLLVGPVWWRRRGSTELGMLKFVGWVYLLGVGIGGYSFWRLSGVFW
ncbi:MAG: hypothetical protein ACE366_22300 [Bradymonadia bacterium]